VVWVSSEFLFALRYVTGFQKLSSESHLGGVGCVSEKIFQKSISSL